MGWLVLGLRPAVENGVRSDSKEACARHEVGMSFARGDGGGGPSETEVRAHEGTNRGRSPQGVTCHRGGRGSLRRAPRPPKLSARVRVLSSFAGNARKNDGLDALATALAASRNGRLATVDHETASEVLRLLSERREDLVAERTRALNRLHGLLRDLVPGGVAGTLSAHRAARILRGIRPQECASSRVRRRLASEILRDLRTLDRKITDLNERIEAEVEASGTTLTQIFGIGPILAARIIGTG